MVEEIIFEKFELDLVNERVDEFENKYFCVYVEM